DEPLRVGATPLVDVPVVVRLDHDEVDVAVGAGVEDLAREARPVREVQPRQLAAGRHVAHPLVHVVATGRISSYRLGFTLNISGGLPAPAFNPRFRPRRSP